MLLLYLMITVLVSAEIIENTSPFRYTLFCGERILWIYIYGKNKFNKFKKFL